MTKKGIGIGLLFTALLAISAQLLYAQLPVPFCVDEVKPNKGKGPWAPYSKLRFMEDYSWLSQYDSESAPYRDSLDKLKYIRLGDNGAYLSIGGRVRARIESYENFNFGPANDDAGYLLTRYLLHTDFHANKHFRIYVEGRSSNVYDRDLPGGKSNSLADEIDVMEAFLDINAYGENNSKLLLRLGRFEQTFGKGRMIGCREWSQIRSPIQGAKIRYQKDHFWIDAFAANSMISEKYEWMEANDDELQYGVYAHMGSDNPNVKHWELYLLGKNKIVKGADVDRVSFGSRWEGTLGSTGWLYDIEGAYQTGTGDIDVTAYFLAMELKKSWMKHRLKPTLKFTFEYASGDKDPNDGEINTFEGIAPYGHFYFGFTDVVGRQNIVSPAVQFVIQPSKKLTLRADFHMFWLAEATDGLYSPCNCSKAIRKGFDGASNFVGSEIDLFFKYGINHRMNVIGGYSHLWAGDFIEETGPKEDIDRIYAQLMFSF